jgi:hydrogenase maturation protease
MSNPKVIIVGTGNEFRGDDEAGILVLKALKPVIPPQVEALEITGDQLDLLELMQLADNLIIADAATSNAPAGTVFKVDANKYPFPNDLFKSVSSHGIDVASSIELARSMKVLPRLALIYAIVGKSFSFGDRPSQEVMDSVNRVKKKILKDVNSIFQREPA